LIDAFQRTLDAHGVSLDFEAAFRSWELQAGFPVIRVSYDDDADVFVVEQERYFNEVGVTVDDNTWHVPINVATAFDANFDDTSITNWLAQGETSSQFRIDGYTHIVDAQPQWFIFNKQGLGFYRVQYDLTNWNAIIDVLNSDSFGTIHALNRAQLIDDSIRFEKDGSLGVEVPFKILDSLIRETEYTPFAAADQMYNELFNVFGYQHDTLNVS